MRAFRLTITTDAEEWSTAVLWEAGTSGIEIRTTGDSQLELLAYFPDDATDTARLQRQLPAAGIAPAEVPQVDWVARFREGFGSFQAGRFRVVPVWELPAERRARPADVLVVDPGRAFGTGTHETTRLCLAALEGLAARRRLGRTLDLGAGTGILAIAAGRLGARSLVASDIDTEATAAARIHARLNRTRLSLVRADGGRGFRPASFDLVLANLTARLLLDRSAEIRSLLAPGGALVLSGLLLSDIDPVQRAFAPCGPPVRTEDGEWAALVFEGAP
jgi:ribosomal protein L11 methyltransferase